MSAEKMRYGMLGEDESSPKEKLEKYTGEVDWSYLNPHYENGVLYFVDPELKLADVGAEISADSKVAVEGWLKKGDLVKIEALHVVQWEGSEQMFEALVVSPFVLCRPI